MVLLKKGSLILHEEPYVYTVRNAARSFTCATCLRANDPKKCLGCKLYHYCSKRCQKKDWEHHKVECKNIQKIPLMARSSISSTSLMMARILNKQKKGELQPPKPLYVNPNVEFPARNLGDLSTHRCEMTSEADNRLEIAEYLRPLDWMDHEALLRDSEDLIEVFCKLAINGLDIQIEQSSVASALYIHASRLNHKCVPNTNHIFYGPNVLITLKEDVELEPDEAIEDKIFTAYGDALETFCNRQKTLARKYFFRCQCEICLRYNQVGEYDTTILANYDPPMVLTSGALDNLSDLYLVWAQRNEKKVENSVKNLLADIDADYQKRYARGRFQRTLLPPNQYPSSTNVVYNKRLLDRIRDIPDINSIPPLELLKAYHMALALYNGNTYKDYYNNDIQHLYMLLWLAQASLYFNQAEEAKKFYNQYETRAGSLFSAEVRTELKRFPQFRSFIQTFEEIVAMYKNVIGIMSIKL